jgi:hypothetical protein
MVLSTKQFTNQTKNERIDSSSLGMRAMKMSSTAQEAALASIW